MKTVILSAGLLLLLSSLSQCSRDLLALQDDLALPPSSFAATQALVADLQQLNAALIDQTGSAAQAAAEAPSVAASQVINNGLATQVQDLVANGSATDAPIGAPISAQDFGEAPTLYTVELQEGTDPAEARLPATGASDDVEPITPTSSIAGFALTDTVSLITPNPAPAEASEQLDWISPLDFFPGQQTALFGLDGPTLSDVRQGYYLGDCSLLASAMVIIRKDPSHLQQILIPNSDDTFTLSLPSLGSFTFDMLLPSLRVGSRPGPILYAEQPVKDARNTYILWPILLTKAVAGITGNYSSIVSKNPAATLQTLIGTKNGAFQGGNVPQSAVTQSVHPASKDAIRLYSLIVRTFFKSRNARGSQIVIVIYSRRHREDRPPVIDYALGDVAATLSDVLYQDSTWTAQIKYYDDFNYPGASVIVESHAFALLDVLEVPSSTGGEPQLLFVTGNPWGVDLNSWSDIVDHNVRVHQHYGGLYTADELYYLTTGFAWAYVDV